MMECELVLVRARQVLEDYLKASRMGTTSMLNKPLKYWLGY